MIDQQKKDLRIICSKKRYVLKKNDNNISFKLKKRIINIEELKKVKIVASFISINTEISVRPLNDYLISLGKKICLPVILDNKKYLIFRLYDKQTSLKRGKFGILEPNKKQLEMLPDLILTPCLAFDQFGYRLGYGGGYYDRTFSRFRRLGHKFISVVVAYDGQKMDQVIRDQNDQKIDYILTEKNLYRSK